MANIDFLVVSVTGRAKRMLYEQSPHIITTFYLPCFPENVVGQIHMKFTSVTNGQQQLTEDIGIVVVTCHDRSNVCFRRKLQRAKRGVLLQSAPVCSERVHRAESRFYSTFAG